MTPEQQAKLDKLVKEVREYALAHYEEDGWDYLIESFSDKEIEEQISPYFTREQAIYALQLVVKGLDDKRNDIQREVF
jgi:hypothetical protein